MKLFQAMTEAAMAALAFININPVKQPTTGAVVFLHGLSDYAARWVHLSDEWAPKMEHVRFVFPQAPNRTVIYKGGAVVPAWYNVYELKDYPPEDEDGIVKSSSQIVYLIKNLIDDGIPANRIVLAGMSQGCAMTMYTAITTELQLAGFVGMSGYIPLLEKAFQRATDANKKTPIFWGHGDADDVIKLEHGNSSAMALKQHGYNVDFRVYKGMMHETRPDEINDVLEFLLKIFKQ